MVLAGCGGDGRPPLIFWADGTARVRNQLTPIGSRMCETTCRAEGDTTHGFLHAHQPSRPLSECFELGGFGLEGVAVDGLPLIPLANQADCVHICNVGD